MNRSKIVSLLVALAVVIAGFGGTGAKSTYANDKKANYVAGELIIQYRDSATESAKDNTRTKVKASKIEKLRDKANGKGELELVAVGSDVDAAIKELSSDPNVEFAEPNWIYTTDATATDPYFTNGSLWGMQGGFGSNAAAAWANNTTGSAGVYVGIIDEGIQFDHPDLAGQVWTNPFDAADGVDNDGNGYVDDIHGWDFDGNDNSIYDGGSRGSLDDHGTHVSGTIAGKANNGQGVVGVNWNVTLISGKFLGRRGGTTANAVKAVDYFTDLKVDQGLNIVATNNSWGGGGFSQALLDAITFGAL